MTTTPLQPWDIYNLNASFKREQRHGLSVNNALIQHLKDHKIHFKINTTHENRTQHLFIAYPQSVQLAQTNQDVVLVDNTYKTNKFDMPLLHLIGKLCTYTMSSYTAIQLTIIRYYKLRNDILNWVLLPLR